MAASAAVELEEMVATAQRLVGGTSQAVEFAKRRHALWKVSNLCALSHEGAESSLCLSTTPWQLGWLDVMSVLLRLQRMKGHHCSRV